MARRGRKRSRAAARCSSTARIFRAASTTSPARPRRAGAPAWIDARIHQFGGVITPVKGKCLAFNLGGKKVFAKKVTIPARPYVGMSEANKTDMVLTAWEFIDKVLQ